MLRFDTKNNFRVLSHDAENVPFKKVLKRVRIFLLFRLCRAFITNGGNEADCLSRLESVSERT